MTQAFSLVCYLKGLCSFVLFCNYSMLNLSVQLVFDEFDCVLIDNGLDLLYKKPNWFLECQKFLIFWGTITKISG